jgi:hypothetical protein
MRHS